MGGVSGPPAETAEQRIRQYHQLADWNQAVTLGLREYGPEIFGFLAATLRTEDQAADAFAQFCLDLWTGIESFRWSCSFRTWAYTLARNARSRILGDPYARRASPLSNHAELSQLAQQLRSQTAPFLRSEIKTRASELRAKLSPDDQVILILRVDKQLEWDEVAQVVAGEELTPAARRRSSATLRKRFERIKEELRRLAKTERLLE